MKHINTYKLFESNSFDETYKIISEQLFYELDDKFRIDPGVFFPLKISLEDRNGGYDLTIALGLGPSWTLSR